MSLSDDEFDEDRETLAVYAGDTLAIRLVMRNGMRNGRLDLSDVRQALETAYGVGLERLHRRRRVRKREAA